MDSLCKMKCELKVHNVYENGQYVLVQCLLMH